MNLVHDLLQNNRDWAAALKKEAPDFFLKLSKQQKPLFFWIGCCDSRVPANQIIGLLPGEVFVHRNIANIVNNADMNCMAALQFAVDVLQVQHVILCGHYGCGGVQATVSLLHDPHPLVRGHAAWALHQIGGPAAQTALHTALEMETDETVRLELAGNDQARENAV